MPSNFYERVGEEGRTADVDWFVEHCVGHVQDSFRGSLPAEEREQIAERIRREHLQWGDVAPDRRSWLIAMAGVADTVHKSIDPAEIDEGEIADKFETAVDRHLEEFAVEVSEGDD